MIFGFRISAAAIIYGALALGAIGLGFALDNPNIYFHPESLTGFPSTDVKGIVIGGLGGVLFGLLIAKLTRLSVYRLQWARDLHTEFRGLLGPPLRDVTIFSFAAFSSVAEELFFRGAIQPELGIIWTSLIFGMLHVPTGKKFLMWTVQAIIMGFALGGLFWATGNLTAPILAHFTINYQNLHFINSYDPSLQLPRSLKGFEAHKS